MHLTLALPLGGKSDALANLATQDAKSRGLVCTNTICVPSVMATVPRFAMWSELAWLLPTHVAARTVEGKPKRVAPIVIA